MNAPYIPVDSSVGNSSALLLGLPGTDVKPRIKKAPNADREPPPMEIVDLGTRADAQSAGPAPLELDFSGLGDEGFERVIFSPLSTTAG